jgi:hypothetical protein
MSPARHGSITKAVGVVPGRIQTGCAGRASLAGGVFVGASVASAHPVEPRTPRLAPRFEAHRFECYIRDQLAWQQRWRSSRPTREPRRLRMGPKALSASPVIAQHRGMTDEPRQCPYCELRFVNHNEVKDHILHDHPDHVEMAVSAEIHEFPH